MRAGDAHLYTAEWQSPSGLKRVGIEPGTLMKGDRVIMKGNPRRDFAESRVMNFKAVTRPADGWAWPGLR